MASCPGPVPSKNALRALRSLAFGTPGLLVGTVGGVCTLAGVQYEIQRKIRLAEDIVDTKRTLASVSTGRGKERVKQMLEAAEKGEHFLIDRHKSQQRLRQRQRRDHSTATVVATHDDDAVLMLRVAGSRNAVGGSVHNHSSSYECSMLAEQDAVPENTSSGRTEQSFNKRSDSQAHRSTEGRNQTPNPCTQPFKNSSLPRSFAKTALRPDGHGHGDGNDSSSAASFDHRAHQPSPSDPSWERLYARDLENSSAERIRLATIQSMKPVNHSVYSQQHRASAPPPLPQSSLDLAPRQDHFHTLPAEPDKDLPAEDALISVDAHRVTSGDPGPSQESHNVETSMMPDKPRDVSLDNSFNVSSIFTSSFAVVEQEQLSDRFDADEVPLFSKSLNLAQSFRDEVTPRLEYSPFPEENMDAEEYRRWLATYRSFRLRADGFRGWMMTLRSLKVLRSNTASLESSLVAAAKAQGNDSLAERILSTSIKHSQFPQKGQAEPLPSQGQEDGQQQSAFSRSHGLPPFVVPPPVPELRVLTILPDEVADIDYDRYASLCTDIAYYPSRLKRELALSSRIEELVSAGSAADLRLAEILFHTLFKPLQGSQPFRRIPVPAIQLAARFLHDGNSQRAAGLLFPYMDEDLASGLVDDVSRETRARIIYGSAHDFLAWFGRVTSDLDKLDQVTRQTLEAATIRGIKLANLPVGYLLAPVIRSFCSRGHVERAHSLLKEVQEQYDIAFSDTLDARAKLMIGYANNNRIVPVKMMLDECHANGVSRQHPRWYSRTFQYVFQRLLRSNPLTESYDLLIHAMAYWGLMPTETVSSVFLSECLRYERYDFIQEYVQAVRELYSFIDLGTDTSLLAWRFGRVWKDMQASCQQILKGCQALAYCATDDPFGGPLRDVIEEASRHNIAKRLSSLLLAVDRPAKVDQLSQLSFPEIIEYAQTLVVDSDSQAAACLEERQELLVQLRALSNLNGLLGGHDPIEPKTQFAPCSSPQTRRPSVRLEGEDGGFNLQIFQTPNILPDRETLWRYLAMHYAHRQRKQLPADHNLLCRVGQELVRLQRSVEAAQLFAAVHESPYGSEATGTPFDENLLQAWLDTATALDSPLAATKVLWAIIEAHDQVIISTPLLLQAKHACSKVLNQLVAKRQGRNPSSFQEEMAYLRLALKRRFERQSSIRPHGERLVWNEYKCWDESTVDIPFDEEEDRSASAQHSDFVLPGKGHHHHMVGPATEAATSMHAC